MGPANALSRVVGFRSNPNPRTRLGGAQGSMAERKAMGKFYDTRNFCIYGYVTAFVGTCAFQANFY